MTYHGVLAPASALRKAIVPGRPAHDKSVTDECTPSKRWIPWALLLARSFGFSGLCCPCCREPMTVRAFVPGVPVATRLLRFLKPQPRLFPARAGPAPSTYA